MSLVKVPDNQGYGQLCALVSNDAYATQAAVESDLASLAPPITYVLGNLDAVNVALNTAPSGQVWVQIVLVDPSSTDIAAAQGILDARAP